jgi:hypothetical protein
VEEELIREPNKVMPKYLPSAFLNEIEAPLRRKFRSQTKTNWLVWVVIGAVIVTILHFTVEPKEVQKAQAAQEMDNAYYCNHLGDYLLGDKAVEIVKYCESIKK